MAKEQQDVKQEKKAPKAAAEKKGRAPATAAPVESGPQQPAPPARLAVQYRDRIVPDLMKKFGYKTTMQVPRIRKITLNMGVGESVGDKKILDNAVADMAKIAGQKPVVTKSRKSIANFKLRAGYPVGCMVTLRGARMYEVLDRLVNVAIPRIRDFRGINRNSFDGRGNFSMGLAEQIVFPEVPLDKIEFTQGMDITMTISGGSDEMSLELLENLGMPFKRG